jgi:hypothetical protein
MKSKSTTLADILNRGENAPDYLPSCAHYAQLLAMTAEKQRITTEEARKRYGLHTYRQWAEILEG